jgi:hypothetical protein
VACANTTKLMVVLKLPGVRLQKRPKRARDVKNGFLSRARFGATDPKVLEIYF